MAEFLSVQYVSGHFSIDGAVEMVLRYEYIMFLGTCLFDGTGRMQGFLDADAAVGI